jgi:DHA2 family multidrug resistance protein-like MFS transporter
MMERTMSATASTPPKIPNAVRSPEDGLPLDERRLAIGVIVIGTVMAVLDGSIANVALPTISQELRVDAAASVWVVNAYQLAVAMLLLPLSSLGDVIGYRKVYAGGIAIFTLGSLACALSHTLPILVAARVLQGVGGAAVMSIAPALLRSIFPAGKLGVAVGISALTVASSSAAGPTIGGALLAVVQWPWLFAINVPIGLFDTLFAMRALPQGTPSGGRFDFASAALSSLALACFVVALDGFARHLPWLAIAGLLAASGVLGFAFVRRQRILAHPMLPLDLVALPRFSLAAVTSLWSFIAQGLAFVALPFLVQVAYGYSPLVSGLLFTPWPLSIAVVAPIAGRLADRLHPPLLSTIGLGVFVVGLGLFALLPAARGARPHRRLRHRRGPRLRVLPGTEQPGTLGRGTAEPQRQRLRRARDGARHGTIDRGRGRRDRARRSHRDPAVDARHTRHAGPGAHRFVACGRLCARRDDR